MGRFIIKYFGVNRMNFWGWFLLGLAIFTCCGFFAFKAYGAFLKGDYQLAILALLSGIGLLLVGLFGLALQTYCSLLAEKLDKQPSSFSPLDADEDSLGKPYHQATGLGSSQEKRGIRPTPPGPGSNS